MAESNAAHRWPLAVAVLLSTLLASASFWVMAAPAPARADPIASLKAQATTVSQELVQQQLQVGAYQQQYSIASAKVASDAASVAQVDQQIAQDQGLIAARTAAVRRQAIRSYMDYGSGASDAEAPLFSGNEEQVQEASEYSNVAAGSITTAVDGLRSAQGTLRTDEAILQQQQSADLADQHSASTALSHADSTQQQLQQLQAQVTGELATAVAQQAAAQAAAAAAAVRAAQAAATPQPAAAVSASVSSSAPAGSAASGTSGTSPADPATTNTDPALNPFLQCVVQAESGGNYGAVSPNGLYMGAFQFSQPTWNMAAAAAGLPQLVGVRPNQASHAQQDAVAVALYALDGERPWLGDRCS